MPFRVHCPAHRRTTNDERRTTNALGFGYAVVVRRSSFIVRSSFVHRSSFIVCGSSFVVRRLLCRSSFVVRSFVVRSSFVVVRRSFVGSFFRSFIRRLLLPSHRRPTRRRHRHSSPSLSSVSRSPSVVSSSRRLFVLYLNVG